MFKNPSQEFVYLRTYSRWIDELNRRETWEETVDRYIDFIEEERGDKIPSKVLRKIKQYMLTLDVMPSMRLVWSAGDAARKNNICAYNCAFISVDSIHAFSETLYILMCGTGVGFSIEEKYVDKLPVVNDLTSQGAGTHVVEDDKKGWANSLKLLLDSLYKGNDLQFDYSKIRKKGERLKTMGGRASGPEPLISLHNYVREVFAKAQGRKLTPLECHDIMCQIAEIVVVGGVRRSSLISLSDLESVEMQTAKSGKFPLRRYMANNSAVYYEKPLAIDFLNEWSNLAKSGSGERGIFNLDSVQKRCPERRDSTMLQGVNPCFTGDMFLKTNDGFKSFEELCDKDTQLINKDGEVVNGTVWKNGIKKVIELTLSNNEAIKCTEDHRFMLNSGEECLAKDLIGKQMMIPITTRDNILNNKSPKVISIKEIGELPVYDFNLQDDTHWGIIAGSKDSSGYVAHNCGEITLRSMQFCNLSEVIIKDTDDLDDLIEKVECATWIGVIQSTFTRFPFLRKKWKHNCEEERLLGVSLTGQMDKPDLITKDNLKALKSKALKISKKAAKILDINISAAITTGKPSGTVSQLVDCASGCHPRFSPYYIRRYRISSTDPLFNLLKDQNVPMSPEVGQRKDEIKNWSESKVTTWVLEFPIKSPDNSITRNEMNAIEQLEHYKLIQENWCEHNQSITVYVKDEEWFEVGNWVYKNWEYVNGVSFLPYDGGNYELAPYEEVDEKTYQKLKNNFPKIDYSKLSQYETNDHTEGSKSYACVGDKCELS